MSDGLNDTKTVTYEVPTSRAITIYISDALYKELEKIASEQKTTVDKLSALWVEDKWVKHKQFLSDRKAALAKLTDHDKEVLGLDKDIE